MEDRELLGLAAKAVGGKLISESRFGDLYEICGHQIFWDPLRDDGQALRLAVRLQLSIHNEHVQAGVAYCSAGEQSDYPCAESGSAEPFVIESDYDATRRAIVLAAAEIGRSMP